MSIRVDIYYRLYIILGLAVGIEVRHIVFVIVVVARTQITDGTLDVIHTSHVRHANGCSKNKKRKKEGNMNNYFTWWLAVAITREPSFQGPLNTRLWYLDRGNHIV